MLKKILYIFWVIIFLLFVLYTARNSNFNNFLEIIENRTFDLRQNMIVNSGYKKPNKDIVIVAIDDASYEYILDKYGEWPLSRDVYAKVVDYIELQHPKNIVFDLMFVKSLKGNPNSDKIFANSFKKYNNLYTAMNFDNQAVEVRVPADLPDKLSVNVQNYSKQVNFDSLTFLNCRTILNEIISNTSNIGFINVSRADDGILRKMPVFVKYKNKFYPQLAFKVGLDLTNNNTDNFVIDKNSNLILKNRKIYLDKDGSAILNWYGTTGTYQHIPFYKILKSMQNGQKSEFNFENKTVYFGTTASSLFDIKTVPVSKLYPGVEVQATYVNNFLDNNFITKVNSKITILTGIILATIVGFTVINISSSAIISVIVLSQYSLYLVISYLLMKYANLWLDVVYPLILGILVFVSAFIIKYIIKSRDFEQQYLLATTDGLTELYNHRYFQEQLKLQVEHSKRYEQPFSLIIIDIDFFKQFNDKFGHQAGDAVLKQVAQILKHSVRTTDIVCRYGGEEMSIILPNTPKDISFSTAEKICKRIASKKFKLNNTQEGNVTISLGVATFPQDAQTASDMIEVADKRLYQSKEKGRNQVN